MKGRKEPRLAGGCGRLWELQGGPQPHHHFWAVL